jgi:hypothetical protein
MRLFVLWYSEISIFIKTSLSFPKPIQKPSSYSIFLLHIPDIPRLDTTPLEDQLPSGMHDLRQKNRRNNMKKSFEIRSQRAKVIFHPSPLILSNAKKEKIQMRQLVKPRGKADTISRCVNIRPSNPPSSERDLARK